MVVVALLLLFGLEIVTLFFAPPFDRGDRGAERWSEIETLGSYESPLRLSEIDGPRIDDTAAMIVVMITIRRGLKLAGALSAWPGIFSAPSSSAVRTPNGITRKADKTQNNT